MAGDVLAREVRDGRDKPVGLNDRFQALMGERAAATGLAGLDLEE